MIIPSSISCSMSGNIPYGSADAAPYQRRAGLKDRKFVLEPYGNGKYLIRDSTGQWTRINKTCHGCKNALGQISEDAGFAVCCHASCSRQSGQRWWCQNCLQKIPDMWPHGCFDDLETPEQKPNWHCPHCTTDPCPAGSNCSSKATRAPADSMNMQNGRSSDFQRVRLAPRSAPVTPISKQIIKAKQLWAAGEVRVCKISQDRVAMAPWRPLSCEFLAVTPPESGHVTLPVVVRMRGPGDIVCDGATDATTCQPRGQCVHIALCKEFNLLQLPEVPPPQHAEEDNIGSDDVLDEEAPTAAWLYEHTGAPATAVHQQDIGEPVTTAIFFVPAGVSSDPTAVNIVHVNKARWKCSHRMHRSANDELHPCACMNTIMDALQITQEDIDEALAAERAAAEMQEIAATGAQPDTISSATRTLELHHRHPVLSSYYIPEELLVQVQASLLAEGKDPFDAIDAMDVDTMQTTLLNAIPQCSGFEAGRCTVHGAKYHVIKTQARVLDGTNPVHLAHVFHVECTGIPSADAPVCKIWYDGEADDIFNLNNTDLFTQRMLVSMLYDIHHKGSSFNSIHRTMASVHGTLPETERLNLVSLPILIRAFFEWLPLIHQLPGGFLCPICGTHPAVLIFDGTGYKVFDKHLRDLDGIGHPTGDRQRKQEVEEFKRRKLIKSPQVREMLVRYSQARATAQCAPLTGHERAQLIQLLREEAQGIREQMGSDAEECYPPPDCIADLIEHVQPEITASQSQQCPAWLSGFLYHLGSDCTSDTVLIQGLPAYTAACELVRHWQRHGVDITGDVGVVLYQDARIIYQMLRDSKSILEQDARVDEILLNAVHYVTDLWQTVIGSKSSARSKSVTMQQLSAAQQDHATAILIKQAELAVYKNWEVLYTRPHYAGLEHANGRSRDTSVYRKCDNKQPTVGSGQRKFSPGICKVSCVHGVTQGYHFFKDPESPNDPFTITLTCYPHNALPSAIFYDNGCKLYEYILNREPWMLQQMRIYVDSFHYGSWCSVPIHKCPASFDGKAHPVAGLFNSQYEEHGNAYVSIHKRSARTMGLQRARSLLATMLQCWNEPKIQRVHRQQQAFEQQYSEACSKFGRGGA